MRLAVLRSCGAVKSRRAAPPHRRAEMRSRFARFGHLFDLNLGQTQNKPHFSFRKKSKQYVYERAPPCWMRASVRKSIFPLESSAAGPSAVGADIDQLDENREEFVEDRVMELAVGSHGPVV